MKDWKSQLKAIKKELSPEEKLQLHSANKRPPPPQSSSGSQHRSPSPIAAKLPQNQFSQQNLPVVTRQPSPTAKHASTPPHGPANAAQARPAPPKTSPPRPSKVPQTLGSSKRINEHTAAQFKTQDAWVSRGSDLQPLAGSASRPAAASIDIYIGLDFGTSYTKAAVGLSDQILPVSWEGISTSPDRYLLPSFYSLMSDGSAVLGYRPLASASEIFQGLKQPFINSVASELSTANAAIFLALVLRYIRAWIYKHHAEKIGSSRVRWLLNIGAPSNGLETERILLSYKRLACVAWNLSQSIGPLMNHDAQSAVKTWTPDTSAVDLSSLDIVPEFVAQIAGYVQSSQRRPGLHALFDIGGGTLDAVTFIVHKRDGEDVFPFLVPEVRPMGTHMLNQNRLVDAPSYDDKHLPDELMPVMEAVQFSQETKIPMAHIDLRDKIFFSEMGNLVSAVLDRTKKTRYRLAPAWSDSLPVFLTGGGAQFPKNKEAITAACEKHAKRLIATPLPQHPKVSEFRGTLEEYQRISVACGLAEDFFALGEIIPARDVEDDRAPIYPMADERPDRDELYAR